MTGIFPDSFSAIATANALGIILNIVILILAIPEEAVLEDLELKE